jgi:chromosomal replication initiator protein
MEYAKIKEIVCEDFGVTDSEIMSRSREQPVALARHFVWYYLRKTHRLKLKEIGSMFDRNHGAIINALKNLDVWRNQDREIQEKFNRLETSFPELKGGQT